MPLTDDEQATVARLKNRLDRDVRGYQVSPRRRRIGFRALDAYYDGEQHIEHLGLAIPVELRQFTTIVAWPGTFVDTRVERRQVEGFRYAGAPKADDELWRIWQANDLDSESPLARIDADVFGRSYYCVGVDDETNFDTPLVTVESPMQMTHEWSNRERRVTAAARFYEDREGSKTVRRATLYLPDETHWLIRGSKGWEDEKDPDEHDLGTVPVVPLVTRGRAHDRYGNSIIGRIIRLTDAAARALTLAQVGTEVMGIPQRTAAGMTQADFEDPATGEALTAWEAYFGAVWATKNKDAKFHQFTAADLSNFSGIIAHYAQLVAGSTGLPMRYFGQLSDNPPSADGIRADESRLIRGCEAANAIESGALERVMRLVNLIRTGEEDPKLVGLETIHRDPSTPTQAQAADAAVKKFEAKIVPLRQTRRDLGYTETQISNMEDEDREAREAERADPLMQAIVDDALKNRGNPDPGNSAA